MTTLAPSTDPSDLLSFPRRSHSQMNKLEEDAR
jgi:hypothetical protein